MRPPAPEAITIGLGSAPLSLDPHLTNESASYAVNGNIYDALVKTDADLRVGPCLATSWSNPDDLTWIFELRQGVRFHDGRPFTAEDVVFSLGRGRNDPASDWKGALVAIQKVDALSPHTVAVTTARPFPTLLKSLVGISIVPAGSAGAFPLESRPWARGPIASSRGTTGTERSGSGAGTATTERRRPCAR